MFIFTSVTIKWLKEQTTIDLLDTLCDIGCNEGMRGHKTKRELGLITNIEKIIYSRTGETLPERQAP